VTHKHKLYIENVVVFANYVYVDGWCEPGDERLVISVASGSDGKLRAISEQAIAKIARPDVAKALKLDKEESAPVGFVFKAPFETIADLEPTQTVLRWVAAHAGQTAQSMTKAKTIGALGGRLHPSASDSIRRAIACDLVDPAVAAFFLAFGNNGHGLPALRGHVDAVMRAGPALGVDLWVENAGARTLVALTEDGASALAPSQILILSRPDVMEALRAQGETITTDRHGVFLLFTSNSTEAKRFLIGSVTDGRIDAVFSVDATALDGGQRLVERLIGILGYGGFPPPDVAEKIFRPLLAPNRAQPVAEARLVFSAVAAEPPKMSIIVPFYGEYYFIRSLLTMQLRMGDAAEWIFVSDDPAIHSRLEAYVRMRSHFLRANTTLVLNKENYGYSLSNLVGVRFAKTDNLLFMNSDIWIDNPQPVLRGLQALQEGEYGLIGFRLLYEDRTVQHDGFAFERRSEIHNLFAVDHPGKGLPPSPVDQPLLVPTVGVTGALLMTTRQVFDEAGGFSSDYVLGDFEDADLCLKVAKSGRKVGLIQAPGIYHLERQSIKKLGNIGYRQMITFLNCIHFNRVWKDDLEDYRRSRSRQTDSTLNRG
jgi:GT2 family glycosyltransferase